MNRNFENRKPTKVYAKSKENQMIIKALNMYGRVPEMWELLEEIEQLEQKKEKITKSRDFHLRFNKSLMNRVDEYQKENEKLQNNRDKAIEFLKTEHMTYDSACEWRQTLINILKGGSDE